MKKRSCCQAGDGAFRVFGGLLLMGLGLVLLADRLGLLEPGYSGGAWPFLAMAVGVVKLIVPPADRERRVQSRRMAGWLLALGFWGLINEYRLMGLAYATSWPLLVVYAGVDMVWRALSEPPAVPRQRVP